jgi:hypothetical protein
LEGADDPQMLDVRQLSGPSLPAVGREDRLLQLLQRQVEEWQRQGASEMEIKQEAAAVPQADDAEPKRIALAVEVSMVLGGVRTHAVSRWIVDHDGRVFRIGVATPPYVPMAEAAKDADFVLQSFRRIAAKKKEGAWLTSDLRLAPAKPAPTEAAQN